MPDTKSSDILGGVFSPAEDVTVKASDDDPSFGFFTRPTKATISDREEASE